MNKASIMTRNANVWRNTSENWYPAINVVDIDWNGAVLPNSNTSFGTSITINTTGEIIRGALRGN